MRHRHALLIVTFFITCLFNLVITFNNTVQFPGSKQPTSVLCTSVQLGSIRVLEDDPQPVATARQLRTGLRSDKNEQGEGFKLTQSKFGALKKKNADRRQWVKESNQDRNKIYLLEIVHSGTPYPWEPCPPLTVRHIWAVLGAVSCALEGKEATGISRAFN